MRIAIIGGADYLEVVFEDWLYKLSDKYPDAVIVTGTAVGRSGVPSAERKAESLMTGLGHTVEIPNLDTPTYKYLRECKMSLSDMQLGAILCGEMQLRKVNGILRHEFITPRPDVIVTVGNEDSSRAAQAKKHWQKMDAWREKENIRPYHNVAAPPKEKKAKKYKATKKVHRP